MGLLDIFNKNKQNVPNDEEELYGEENDNGYYSGEDEYDEGDNKPVTSELTKAPTQSASNKVEVKLVRPTSHLDAPQIADKLIGGCIVVMDIDNLEKEPAIRLIDFLAGVIHVLGGQMQKTNRSTIVVAPAGVNVADFGLEEDEEEVEEDEDEETESE